MTRPRVALWTLCLAWMHLPAHAGAQVLVKGTLDLVVTSVANPASAWLGDSVQVTVTLRNAGTASIAAGPWSSTLYLSPDTSITTADIVLLRTSNGPLIVAGSTVAITLKALVPASLQAGKYYVGVIANDANTFPETGRANNVRVGQPMVLSKKVDLVALGVGSTQSSVAKGQSISVSATVANIGNASSTTGWKVDWYLSADTLASADDALLGSATAASITPSGSVLSGTFPVSVAPGSYYLIVKVDADNILSESSEANNVAVLRPAISVTGPAALTIAATSFNYGSVAAGSTSASATFTVTNPTPAASLPVSVSLAGSNPADFKIQSTTCSGITLPSGATCTINALFSPAVSGSRSATIAVVQQASTTVSAALSGTAVTPATLTPGGPRVNFGPTPVGAVIGTTGPVQILNSGGTPSATISVVVSGTNQSDFVVSADQCSGLTLLANSSCTISVAFKPTAVGARAASLTVAAAGTAPANVPLSGTAVLPPDLVVTDIAFGKWVGDSVDVTYTFKNIGAGVAATHLNRFSVCLSLDGINPISTSCGGGNLLTDQLAAGATEVAVDRLTLQRGESYYFIVTVDSANSIYESNEQNNRLVSAKKLTRP
jgi:hypothetical protein